MMDIYDIAIASATVILILNHLPQILRNFEYKRTFSQSISRELMHVIGVVILIWAYSNMGYMLSVCLSIFDIGTEFILLTQIILWHRKG